MPIPNDPENRYWVDISSANPKLMDELSPSLVGFLAFDYGRMPELAGTGFFIGAGTGHALVITAKHVLTEGVLNIQRPIPRHAPSALFIPDSSKKPLLHEEKVRAIYPANIFSESPTRAKAKSEIAKSRTGRVDISHEYVIHITM